MAKKKKKSRLKASTTRKRDRALKMFQETDLSQAEIVRQVGTSESQLSRWISEAGLRGTRGRAVQKDAEPDQRVHIEKLLRLGMAPMDVAAEVGCHNTTVYAARIRLGMKPPDGTPRMHRSEVSSESEQELVCVGSRSPPAFGSRFQFEELLRTVEILRGSQILRATFRDLLDRLDGESQ